MTPAEELKQANELLDEAVKLFKAIEHDQAFVSFLASDIRESSILTDRIHNRPRATEDAGTGGELHRLADALVENIIETSDEEILKEVEEDHGDAQFVANKMRGIIADARSKRDE